MILKNVEVALVISQNGWSFVCLTFSKAMEKVMRNKAMIEAIGEPIEKGPWYNASLAVSQQRHSVSCSFPVVGPQGTGILHLKAVRNGGKYSQNAYMMMMMMMMMMMVLTNESPCCFCFWVSLEQKIACLGFYSKGSGTFS